MFVGRFERSLDAKGRLVLPADYREQFAAGCYVTEGLDACLAIFKPEDFEQEAHDMVERVKRGEVPRAALRSFAAAASLEKPDNQGRVPIPGHLREYAGLERDLVVTGAVTCVEVWDASRYTNQRRQGQSHMAGNRA